jgi:hypothetical protein
MDIAIEKTLNSLKKNKIKAEYFENSAQAVESLLAEIEADKSVGIGGSVTVNSLGIPQKLIERGNKVFFHWLEATAENKEKARQNAKNADIYLSSTNALTENGELVNIDGTGNRVAAMVYGPRRVYIICGKNKVTKDLDAAFKYIKANTYKNARRLNLKTPCAATGECNNCSSPDRMCNVTTIIERKPANTDLKVIIIGEELGF